MSLKGTLLSNPVNRARAAGIAVRERILAEIARLTSELGRPPTPPELERALDMRHPRVYHHIQILIRGGKVRRVVGGRALELVPQRDPGLRMRILDAVGQLQCDAPGAVLLVAIAMLIDPVRVMEIGAVAEELVRAGELVAREGGYRLPEGGAR